MADIGADVVNGTARKGDRVAYATRDGNAAAIHLGTVTEVTPGKKLKIRVECETNARWRTQEIRTVSALDRVVVVDRPSGLELSHGGVLPGWKPPVITVPADPAEVIQSGIHSINWVRERLDLPPWANETSEPVVFTAEGPIPLSQAPEALRKKMEDDG